MVISKRYKVMPDGTVKQFNFDFSIIPITMDKIVDKSKYRPDSELVRTSSLSGSGLGKKGVFDDLEKLPDNFVVSMRSGKFDKAEIQAHFNDVEAQAHKAINDKVEADKLAERQLMIDEKLGLKNNDNE